MVEACENPEAGFGSWIMSLRLVRLLAWAWDTDGVEEILEDADLISVDGG